MQPKSYEHLVSKTMERFNVPREQASLFVSGAVDALQAEGDMPPQDLTEIILQATGLQMARLEEAQLEESDLAAVQLDRAQAAQAAALVAKQTPEAPQP